MNFRRFQEDDDSQWGMLDVLYIMLIGFIVMFFIAIQHMNPVRKMINDDPKAEYQITMTWQPDHTSDVDLWVQDPTGAKVSFRDTTVNLMHLDRDDLGSSSDVMVVPETGQVIVVELNREVVSLRGIVPGWWTVNVHLYGHTDKRPAQVHVEVTRINPYVVVDIFDTTLDFSGQEQTVLRFKLDSKGNTVNKNRLSKQLFDGTLGDGGSGGH